MFVSCWLSLILVVPRVFSAPPNPRPPHPECHYLPEDPQWPSRGDWTRLNATVGGRLIAGQPLAHVCHGSDPDPVACANVRSQWSLPQLYFPDPVNIMEPYWSNLSCNPFTTTAAPCLLGNLASYAINVSTAADVAAGLAFAKQHNIRIQVKNTGHDYLGRSTGKGSLALWTHNLKTISFVNYTSSHYTGPAVKLGAGVQLFEVYPAGAAHGLRVSGGYCPTVGIAGGYAQGAGHGPLLGTYGLAADNSLELEVVTVDGQHLIVNPTNHADLFWALSGGGGGNYAVVLSHTARAHRDGRVAGASLTVDGSSDIEAYWAVVSAWHRSLLVFDTLPGLTTVYRLTNTTFQLTQGTYADHTASDLQQALNPFLQEVKKLGLNYTYEVNNKPTYYDHFMTYTPSPPYGTYLNNETIGGRLIGRQAVMDDLPGIIQVIRNITNSPRGPRINGVAGNATHARVGNTPASNAVLPAWRDALYHLIIEVLYSEEGPTSVFQQAQVETNAYQELLRAVTPNGGAYINEATFDNPHWKEDYFGINYERLLTIKERYDPEFLLYGPASVGSDTWAEAADGRLCKQNE